MTETFAALLFAHVCADFLLQSDQMAAAKHRRAPTALLLHAVIVLATATLAVAPAAPDAAVMIPLLVLTGAHIVIDLIKTFAPSTRLSAFLIDQAAHGATIWAVATWAPDLFGTGLWADQSWLPPTMVFLAGLLIATQAGGYAIGMLVRPYGRAFRAEGLPRGGLLIGQLERGLIYLLILVGQPAAVGFLIAAKSVLRFDASKRKQKAAEYVIIGTLASFGWALVSAYASTALLDLYPPLGFLPVND